MTERLKTLCSLLYKVNTFADIGCDHGYCSQYMLDNGLCDRALITDISAECLKKAEILLADYIAVGRCASLRTDGLNGVDRDVNLVLIAGMGGMEIAHILNGPHGFIPSGFVLQPMRDARVVRETLIERGAKIERDFTFYDGKFYHVVTGRRTGGNRPYTEAELNFGRENIRVLSEDFKNFLRGETEKKRALLERPLSPAVRAETEEKIRYLQGVLSGEIK